MSSCPPLGAQASLSLDMYPAVAPFSNLSSWNKGSSMKRCAQASHIRGKRDESFCPKLCLRARKVESGFRSAGSNVLKHSIRCSYVPNERDTCINYVDMHNDISLSYALEESEGIPHSLASQNLFKNWIKMLLVQSPSQMVEEISGEPSKEVLQLELSTQNKNHMIKPVWEQFWSLDASIKVPLLLFMPLFLAVNVMYGTGVSKELAPVWIIGPLIASIYIKIVRRFYSLYAVSFKQTIEIVKRVHVMYDYAQGKLRGSLQSNVWQQVANIKNEDCRKLLSIKVKQLQDWMDEKYLDYLESMWPVYRKSLRLLNKANLL